MALRFSWVRIHSHAAVDETLLAERIRPYREMRLQTHGMTRYLASRLAGMVVVMLIVATLVFFITRLAPGDPAAVMLGEQASAADIANLRASYGLDRPLPVQFAYWLKELAHGNLGQS